MSRSRGNNFYFIQQAFNSIKSFIRLTVSTLSTFNEHLSRNSVQHSTLLHFISPTMRDVRFWMTARRVFVSERDLRICLASFHSISLIRVSVARQQIHSRKKLRPSNTSLLYASSIYDYPNRRIFYFRCFYENCTAALSQRARAIPSQRDCRIFLCRF